MPVDATLLPLIRQAGIGYPGEQLLSAALPRTTGGAPGTAAGANNGGSPPAPSLVAGSTDGRGGLQFGSGTTPAAGEQVVVTFASTYGAAPVVTLAGGNAATSALGAIYPGAVTATGFTVRCMTAPTASQGGTVFLVQYKVTP
jgi:hypothetical protein